MRTRGHAATVSLLALACAEPVEPGGDGGSEGDDSADVEEPCLIGSMDPEGQDGDGLTDEPSWLPGDEGPWTESLWAACSSDGLQWTKTDAVIQRADVPSLIRTTDGRLIATFQYFSWTDEDAFNRIAWSASDDDGATWTPAESVQIDDLPNATDDRVPVDPALVELSDGRLRLYLSWWAAGDPSVGLHSAISSGFGEPFTYEPGLRLELDADMRDPGIIWFDGKWHHYAQINSSDIVGEENYHSTSEDGLSFVLQPNIRTEMMMLGNPVEMDGGLRFYASDRQDMISAWSANGYEWTLDDGVRIEDTWDGAVAPLPDGRWLMIYPAPTPDSG